MSEDRKLILEMVTRYRESLSAANRTFGERKAYWLGRAEAYNEVYTELKGRHDPTNSLTTRGGKK